MLDTRLTEEQQSLRKTVEAFTREVVAPVSYAHDRDKSFPYEVVRGMAEMGLFGLPFPEEYGGMGGDYFALCLAIEELARVDQSVAITLEAVEAQASSPDAILSLLPVGLGERGGEINQFYRNAFDRVVLNDEDPQTVLEEEAANLQALLDETGAACWAPDPPSDGPCQVE